MVSFPHIDLGTALGMPGWAQPEGGQSNSTNIREPVTCIIYAVFLSDFRYLPYVQSQEIEK